MAFCDILPTLAIEGFEFENNNLSSCGTGVEFSLTEYDSGRFGEYSGRLINSTTSTLAGVVPNNSYSFWFKSNSSITGFQSIFAIGTSLDLGTLYNNSSVFTWYPGGITLGTVTEEEWYHIVVTINTATTCVVYVNGVSNSVNIASLGQTIFFGKCPTGYMYPDMSIDQLRVYDYLLTQDDVNTLYNEVEQPPITNKPVFGTTEITNFMAGSTQVDKVMVGSELLWEGTTNKKDKR